MNLFKLKIKALLHDPPHKPISLMNQRESHEKVGQDLIAILLGAENADIPDAVKKADHIASAADRYSFPFDWAQPWRFSKNFLKSPVLIHPISGECIPLENLKALDVEEVKSVTKQAIQEIADTYPSDEQRYLALWRLLPDLVKKHEAGNAALGELWDLLPADTRIPDHSIWSHQRIVSALAGAGIGSGHQKAALVLFSLGPVQDFIAAAKKTRDFWAGSYMLSWLSWKAMEVFADSLGPDCILFPDLHGQPLADDWLKKQKGLQFNDAGSGDLRIPTLPNRFFAMVPNDKADELCQKAKDAVIAELLEIGKFSWKETNLDKFDVSKELWNEQLSKFLELNWTILPVPFLEGEGKSYQELFSEFFDGLLEWDDLSNQKTQDRTQILNAFDAGKFKTNIGTVYGRLYELIEKINGSRKSVRDFDPVQESGYRCTLIPRLSALTPGDSRIPSTSDFRKFWEFLSKNFPSRIGQSERLSAVALSKRYFDAYLRGEHHISIPSFVSTHSFAAADFKYDVLKHYLATNSQEEFKNAVKRYYTALGDFEQLLKSMNLEDEDVQVFEGESLPKIARLTRNTDQALELLSIKCFDRINGLYFFKDMVNAEYLAQNFNIELNTGFREGCSRLAHVLSEMLAETDKAGIARPVKYYGVLHFDGDHMGRWLSGDNAPGFTSMLHPGIADEIERGGEGEQFEAWDRLKDPNLKRPLSPSLHASISSSLKNFSLYLARGIVEKEHLGKLIYAGGDDVVAMVSFRDGLSCMEMLRLAYSGFIREVRDEQGNWSFKTNSAGAVDSLEHDKVIVPPRSGYTYIRTGWTGESGSKPVKSVISTMGPTATGSAGISFVHMFYPLKQAFLDSRQAEQYAKDTLGRDAFAVKIVKRSSETYTAGYKWYLSSARQEQTISRVLAPLLEDVRAGYISPKCPVDMGKELIGLSSLPPKAIKQAYFRIYDRHAEGLKQAIRTQKQGDSVCERFDLTIGKLVDLVDDQSDLKMDQYEIMKLINLAFYMGKGGVQ